jgi:hypothetical protein
MSEFEHMTEAKMRELLREAYSADPENSFLGEFTRHLSDPAMPRDAKHRFRVHPLWLILGVVLVFVLSVLVYFSFLRS